MDKILSNPLVIKCLFNYEIDIVESINLQQLYQCLTCIIGLKPTYIPPYPLEDNNSEIEYSVLPSIEGAVHSSIIISVYRDTMIGTLILEKLLI